MKHLLNYIACLLITLSFTLTLNAQKFDEPSYEAIAQNIHPSDSTAKAAILNSLCVAKYDPITFELTLNYEFMVKVYSDDVDEYGVKRILLQKNGSDEEKISGIKAKVYNLDEDNKIVVNKLKKDQIFKSKLNKNRIEAKLVFPNVVKGSIVHYKYRINSPFSYSVPKWNFQRDIPVDSSYYSIQIPNSIGITPITRGAIILNQRKERVNFSDHGERTLIYSGSNIPAMPDDEYVLNTEDYRSSLKYEVLETNVRGSYKKNYSKDWLSIGDNLLDNSIYKRLLTKESDQFKGLIEAISAKSEYEKLDSIYSYVKENFSWNEYIGRNPENGFKKLLSTKSGNCADINLLLVNLLNRAGLEAYPLLTKHRNRGILVDYYPSLTELDYVLACAKTSDGKEYILDATDPLYPLGTIPARGLNIQGLLVAKKESQIIPIPNKNVYSLSSLSELTLDVDKKCLIGSGVRKYKSIAAVNFKNSFNQSQSENYDEDDEEVDNEDDEDDESISDIETKTQITNFNKVNSPLIEEFDEQIFSAIKIIEDKIIIDGDLNKGLGTNPFTMDKREFPIHYNELYKINIVSVIDIPEGYQLTESPSNLKMELIEKKGSFTYMFNDKGDQLQIIYKYNINSDFFFTEEYPGLKEFYAKMLSKQNEKIVLEKIKE